MASEKDMRVYYRKKIKLVRAIDDKWREIASGTPARAIRCIPAAEELVRELEEIDQHYIETFGEPSFREALQRQDAGDPPSAPSPPDRELLRQSLLSAVDTLMQAKARLQDLKKDLGRRLSDLRSRQRGARHGQFDQSG